MRKVKRTVKNVFRATFGIVLLGLVGGGFYINAEIQPTGSGEKFYYRRMGTAGIATVLTELQEKGVVRNARIARLYGTVRGNARFVKSGVYDIRPGMTLDEVYKSLANPIRQMVRIPEGRWAARVSKLLEDKEVAPAKDYLALVAQPEKFKDLGLALPEDSLEGYLYPDTYELPPTIGAEVVIARQLQNFAKRVKEAKLTSKDWHRTLTIASMIELEASDERDRHMISGVIQNRLRIRMPLQIDATVNYGLQKWRRLTYADYRNTQSPYNTYKTRGLPPGPICSPTISSIKAALNPVKHPYIYYVALPSGETIYAATYPEHLANVRKRRAAVKALEAKKPATP